MDETSTQVEPAAPAFAAQPTWSFPVRVAIGLLCTVISLGILVGICYILENEYKPLALKEIESMKRQEATNERTRKRLQARQEKDQTKANK